PVDAVDAGEGTQQQLQRMRLSLNDLAAIAHMSASRLKKAFFIMFQQTIYQFILHRKMAFASEKIEEDELSLTQIARLCGYRHNSNFIAAFKKVYGYTPASIRPQN
ncbi:MAG: helix-turn-helix domain-containing protein, partial [Chitinophagaceae bacterium]